VESDGFHPAPAHLALIILDAGMDQFEQAMRLENAEAKNSNRAKKVGRNRRARKDKNDDDRDNRRAATDDRRGKSKD
jgi:hypothetical protein